MKKIFGIRYIILPAIIGMFMLNACEPEEEELPEVRLFRPSSTEIKSSGTWFSAEWRKIKGAVSYTAEVSVDSFETNYLTAEVDTSYVLFENLDESTTYFVRVRANDEDPEFSSKWAYFGKIWIGRMPTILQPQNFSETTANSFIVRWEAEDDVPTTLKVTKNSDGSLIHDITLTEDDLSAEFKEVTDLSPGTLYRVTIYSGEQSLGYELFLTKAE